MDSKQQGHAVNNSGAVSKHEPKPRSGIDEGGYRKIATLFELISADNGGCTADQIEAALSGVSDADLETLAAGEFYDQLRVKRAIGARSGEHVAEALEQLLNVAFQGPLSPSDFAPEELESSSDAGATK